MTDGTDMDDVPTVAPSSSYSDGHEIPEFMSHAGFEQELLNNCSSLICFCRRGVIEYVNAKGVRMLRSENVKDLVGRPFSDFCADDFSSTLFKDLDILVRDDEDISLQLQSLEGVRIDVTMRVFQINERETHLDPVYMIECNEISQHIKAPKPTRQFESRVASILQTITDGIIMTDEIGTIEDINPAAEKMFGVSKQEAVGKNVRIFFNADEQESQDATPSQHFKMEEALNLGELREAEAARADGTTFPIEITISNIDEGDGGRKFIGVMRDITARKQHFEQIEFLAHHDALTALPNRRLFHDRLTQALVVAARRKSRLALMFIDLDKFKFINDTLGHEAGDIVLKSVAMRLLGRVRASDTVARVGGDEFVVILDDVGGSENAAQIAKGMIATLRTPIEAGGEQCVVGASIGIAMYPEDADTAMDLLSRADDAMFRVKDAGRNNYLLWNSSELILTKNS